MAPGPRLDLESPERGELEADLDPPLHEPVP
jgi:hypothetical protein